MRLTLLQLALVGSTFAARFGPEQLAKLRKSATTGNIVPNKFFVEIAPGAAGKRSADDYAAHDALHDAMRKRGVAFDVVKQYHEDIISGSVVDLQVCRRVMLWDASLTRGV